ncbi:hypothetical protein [Natrinema gelatinilyticum]|uniref:hypothetical protein n=1 Tax=Natrinema gelatinilyticum TaxID=2961571 RepID=UPI0020C372E4|nr:hypothetical protein [Natrinema gelatinilyticum]
MHNEDDAFSSFEAMRPEYGSVLGEEANDVDLDSCELVAQAYDDHSNQGTRLYHVRNDRYALSRYGRSVGREWTEEVLQSGRLLIDPAILESEPIAEAVRDAGADPLTDDQLERVRSTYADVCSRAIWTRIDADETNNGLIIRGPIACVEAYSWRDDLQAVFPSGFDELQVDGILDGIMDARPTIEDWLWYRLYAPYVARLTFRDDSTGTDAE